MYNHIHSDCLRASGGSSIFVHFSCPQREIKLSTDLQAVAVSVTLEKEITLCSVYIPSSFALRSEHLNSLLQQLSSPFFLLGDLNGHNVLSYLKFAKLQFVSSGFRCRVITGSLMRLY